MPMSPRLLRPRQTIHPEAADWANRVRTNGGSVSGTTLNAVDHFVKAIHAAGIRDRFYRLNLFCGNSDASLNAVRTPLYRGPSLTGTQYGGTTDTNNNFVAGDYAETGASGGLTGNNSTKYLDTSLALSALPSVATGHLAVYKASGVGSDDQLIGVRDAAGAHLYRLYKRGNSDNDGIWGGVSVVISATNKNDSGLLLVSRTSSSLVRLFHNGAQVAENTTSTTPGTSTRTFFVFADNSGSASSHWPSTIPLRGYSIGDGLSDNQAAAYSAAMNTFQSALGRT